jgi:hypothetical protein
MSARVNIHINIDEIGRGRRFTDISPSALIGGVAAVTMDEIVCVAA